MSCHYQKLFCGSQGYVVMCKECGVYQIAFLSSLITLKSSEYAALTHQVRQLLPPPELECNDNSKCIVIHTPSRQSAIIMTPRELCALHKMLDMADTEEKTGALLQLFETC